MRQVGLAFGRIHLRHLPDDQAPLAFVRQALEAARPRESTAGSTSVSAFIGIQQAELLDLPCCFGSFGYASGLHYQTIDPSTRTLREATYEVPPVQGQSMFVIDDNLRIVVEHKSQPQLQPAKVLGAIEVELRRTAGFEYAVSTERLGLKNEVGALIGFIDDLDKLYEIVFKELRHSNPRERSRYMDEAADQRVDEIRHRSSDVNGIDRTHEEFQNELEHVKNGYARIGRAAGIRGGRREAVNTDEDAAEIEIDIETDTPEIQATALLRALRNLASRLRPWGNR